MTGVDDLAKYVDYPICKMLITLDPARRDEVWAAGKKQFDGRIDLYPSSPFFIEPYRWRCQGRQPCRPFGAHGPWPRKPDGLRRRPE